MRRYLSFGAGVNSTALMLLLLDDEVTFEAVFSDTGCEKPETYGHLDLLEKEGYEVTRITPVYEGFDNLYDYMWSRKMIPIIHLRICTANFKTRPIAGYVEKPCEMMIGYDFGERRRRHLRNRKDITYTAPLVERRVTRERCVEIIREHGLPVPMKSGCYLCPFQSKRQWKWLRDTHPDLFKKAMALEENARTRDPSKRLYRGGTLSSIWQENKLTDYLEAITE